SAMAHAVTEIRRTTGRAIDLDNPDHVPLDDRLAVLVACGLPLHGASAAPAEGESTTVVVQGDGSEKSGTSYAQCPAGTQLVGGGVPWW
ncbi:hypothetical protein, partial [Streptomyces bacillaris]|uniref:hypothetical protein n=1 Tax=Streptomyces bacillaris TaxID=68179 RepID=UPI00380CAC9B